MNLRNSIILSIVMGGLALEGSAFSIDLPGAQGTPVSAVNQFDRDFLVKAYRGGNTEVELGRLAQKKAGSKDVKDFAETMIWDHGKADTVVEALANQRGIALPKEVEPSTRQKMAELSGLDSAAFDKAYVDLMVEDHKTDVAEFENAVGQLSDPEIKGFAEKTLPVLKGHLERIEGIAKQQNNKGG